MGFCSESKRGPTQNTIMRILYYYLTITSKTKNVPFKSVFIFFLLMKADIRNKTQLYHIYFLQTSAEWLVQRKKKFISSFAKMNHSLKKNEIWINSCQYLQRFTSSSHILVQSFPKLYANSIKLNLKTTWIDLAGGFFTLNFLAQNTYKWIFGNISFSHELKHMRKMIAHELYASETTFKYG